MEGIKLTRYKLVLQQCATDYRKAEQFIQTHSDGECEKPLYYCYHYDTEFNMWHLQQASN